MHVAGPGVEVRDRRDVLLVVGPNLVELMSAFALGAASAAVWGSDAESLAILFVGAINVLPLAAMFGAWVARNRLTRDPGVAHPADPTIVGRPLTDQAAAVLGPSILAAALPMVVSRLALLVPTG